MATRQQARLARIKQREAELKAQRREIEARQKERARKREERCNFLFGEVARAAITSGELDADTWRSWCKKFISHESRLALALEEISGLAVGKKEPGERASQIDAKAVEATGGGAMKAAITADDSAMLEPQAEGKGRGGFMNLRR